MAGSPSSSTTRLRSRSLINAKRDDVGSASAVPALATIESPSTSEPELSSNGDSSVTDSPPPTPTSLTMTGLDAARPRSASLGLFPSGFIRHDLKGKAKAEAYPEATLPRQSPKRKTSWLALSIPFTPFSAEPALSRHAEHAPSSSAGSLGGFLPVSNSAPQAAHQQPGVYSLVQPIAILCAIFVASTAVVVFAISTVPTLAIPKSLADVAEQGAALKRYSTGSLHASVHILGVLTVLFLYKQAFSIPGSLLTNILFGSLYGVFWSTAITSVLTAVGSLLCYLMAHKLSPLVRHFLPRPLAFVERSIDARVQGPADLFSYLLLMRLFPLLPYAVLNIAGGVLAIPTNPFFWTLVLGSIPYNLVTTSAGDLLSSLPIGTELSSIWTPAVLAKFFLISTCSALPILFKSQIQTLLGGAPEDLEAQSDSPSSDDDQHIPLRARKTASVIINAGEGPALLEEHWEGPGMGDLERRNWVTPHDPDRAW